MSFDPGAILGDYKVIETLGVGGMGRVYKVRNLILNRIEAAKILLPDLSGAPELADRFMREIQVQASLNHPHIASVHTALRFQNQLVSVMEIRRGGALDALRIKQPRRRPWRIDGLRLSASISRPLSFALYGKGRSPPRRQAVEHHDRSAGCGQADEQDCQSRRRQATPYHSDHLAVGSAAYMAPEQIPSAIRNPRSDLY